MIDWLWTNIGGFMCIAPCLVLGWVMWREASRWDRLRAKTSPKKSNPKRKKRK